MEKTLRIGVTADTHGDFSKIKLVLNALPDVDFWIHLGDFGSDSRLITELTGKHVEVVRGNCDATNSDNPTEKVIEYGGVKIFLTHGHLYNVNSNILSLALRAKELNCSVALYGHTHIPQIDMHNEVLILNPGSPTKPLSKAGKTVGLLTIENSKAKADIFKI